MSSGEPRWRRYLRFFGPRGVADLDDELRFHVEMRVRDYVAQGMSEGDARAATARRLGDMAHARETCATIATKRDSRMRRAQIIDALTQDVRFALRTLARQKTWAAVAVFTLALGIGATSAMYSVINHLLLNPTPYPGGDRVTVILQLPSEGNATGMSVAMVPMGRLVDAWMKHSRSFEAIEPYKRGETMLSGQAFDGQGVQTAFVLPSFAVFADAQPLFGRMFTAEEASGAANVVVLSEGFWQSQFGGDRDVLGKTIPVGEQPRTIIGVMPARFQLPRTFENEADLWLPLDFARADDDGLTLIGRLRPGVTRAAAGAELDSIMRRTEPAGSQSASVRTVVMGPSDNLSYRDLLVMLAAAVGLVLLIACANVAHLLLARAATRQREMSIRAALGAGSGRLFRQLFTESLILSVTGGLAGLVVGWASLRALIATRPGSLDALGAVHMDQSTFAITALVAVLTGLAFGVIGAVQAGRHSTAETLKAGAQTSSDGRVRVRGRGLLVVTEMALCTMLLVGATLLIRSMVHLQAVDPRFDAAGLLSYDFNLPETRYKTADARRRFYVDLAERVKRIPGVAAATVAAAAPMTQTFFVGALQIDDQPNPPNGTSAFINGNAVPPEYFAMMKMPIRQGTTFTDTTQAASQAIVSKSMADSLWPGVSPLGRRIRVAYNGQGQWRTVVGVAADAMTRGLTQRSNWSVLFIPFGPPFGSTLMVRTADATMSRTVARLANEIDPLVIAPRVFNIEAQMQRSIARPRFTMFLLTVLTAIAVALAAVGLYGVLAYTVTQRTREIGIRMALGASRGVVATNVLRQGIALAAVGAILGLAGARAATRLVSSMLYGVGETDAASFAAGAAALAIIAVLACLIPMRRAVAVDPIIAVKAD